MVTPRPLSFINQDSKSAGSLRKSRRSTWHTGLFAFLVGCTILFGGAKVCAQGTAASHFGNVSGWKAMVSVSGNGSGTFHQGNCTIDYSNNQLIDLSPELQGVFPDWSGPSFPSNVSVVLSITSTCPNGLGGFNVCLQTITGLGGVAPLDNFILEIDAQNNTYTLLDAGHDTNVTITSCDETSKTTMYPWGPLTGPSGGSGAIPFVNASYPLPAHGVHLQMTIPPFEDIGSAEVVPWNISWAFSPVCKIDTSKLGPGVAGQGAQPWGGKQYDDDAGETISTKGCALTCLSMALNFAGITEIPSGTTTVPNDPGSLNTVMGNSPGDFGNGTSGANGEQDFGVINWDSAVRDAQCGGPCPGGNKTSRFKYKPTNGGSINSKVNPDAARAAMDEVLCGSNPHPVIVGVKSTIGPKFPGHFVLVTGRNADDTYDIVDPAGKATSLNDPPYNGNFITRGFVTDPVGDISGLDYFVSNNATILVTDPKGLQTGLQSRSGHILQAIHQSEYAEDALDNDVTEAPATTSDHLVTIFQPSVGRYVAVIQGLTAGSYNVSIRAFSQDGSAQPPIVLHGMAEQGSTFTYVLNYLSTPGSTSTVTPMPGDRNGDGVVNCADLDIAKASFGKRTGESGFDPRADVNGDGIVNILDLSIVARQLPAGTTCP